MKIKKVYGSYFPHYIYAQFLLIQYLQCLLTNLLVVFFIHRKCIRAKRENGSRKKAPGKSPRQKPFFNSNDCANEYVERHA